MPPLSHTETQMNFLLLLCDRRFRQVIILEKSFHTRETRHTEYLKYARRGRLGNYVE